jgi:hypothetical protein
MPHACRHNVPSGGQIGGPVAFKPTKTHCTCPANTGKAGNAPTNNGRHPKPPAPHPTSHAPPVLPSLAASSTPLTIRRCRQHPSKAGRGFSTRHAELRPCCELAASSGTALFTPLTLLDGARPGFARRPPTLSASALCRREPSAPCTGRPLLTSAPLSSLAALCPGLCHQVPSRWKPITPRRAVPAAGAPRFPPAACRE